MHAAVIAMIEHALGLFLGMLRIKKYILFAPATRVIIKILKSFPLGLRNILIELFLTSLLYTVLLLTSFRFLFIFLKFWYVICIGLLRHDHSGFDLRIDLFGVQKEIIRQWSSCGS